LLLLLTEIYSVALAIWLLTNTKLQKKVSLYKNLERRITWNLLSLIAKFYLHKPDLTHLLHIKYPTFKQIFYGIVNELFYVIGVAYGAKLNAYNVEITNACNLWCKMYPVNRGMKRKT
jgi:hypothetical protein